MVKGVVGERPPGDRGERSRNERPGVVCQHGDTGSEGCKCLMAQRGWPQACPPRRFSIVCRKASGARPAIRDDEKTDSATESAPHAGVATGGQVTGQGPVIAGRRRKPPPGEQVLPAVPAPARPQGPPEAETQTVRPPDSKPGCNIAGKHRDAGRLADNKVSVFDEGGGLTARGRVEVGASQVSNL